MPKWRGVNSPTDFCGIVDAIKIVPVIKYLAALKSSRGFLRASPGFLEPKALGGFQGLICSPSVLLMLTAMLCHWPSQQPDLISETTDLGWEAARGESTALHVSLLFFWWVSSTARVTLWPVMCWQMQPQGFRSELAMLVPCHSSQWFSGREEKWVRLINFWAAFTVASVNTVVVSFTSVPSSTWNSIKKEGQKCGIVRGKCSSTKKGQNSEKDYNRNIKIMVSHFITVRVKRWNYFI